MAQITTEDCKLFLVNYFKSVGVTTIENNWKRTSKYKMDGVWHRDFTHPGMNPITLTEENSTLKVYIPSSKPIVQVAAQKAKTYYQKSFITKDIEGAKKIILKAADVDDMDELTNIDLFNDCYHSLPSQISFNFIHLDSHYNNTPPPILNGLKTLLRSSYDEYDEDEDEDDNSFSISLHDKNGKIDSSTLVQLLEYGLCPDIFYVEEEEGLLVLKENVNNITIEEAFELMLSLGFTYNSNTGYKCVFKNELDTCFIASKVINDDTKKLQQDHQIRKAIRNQDTKSLKGIISTLQTPLNSYCTTDGLILQDAIRANSLPTFDLLLQSGVNIWLKDEYTSISESLFQQYFNSHDLQVKANTLPFLRFILTHMENDILTKEHEKELSSILDKLLEHKEFDISEQLIQVCKKTLTPKDFNHFLLKNLVRLNTINSPFVAHFNNIDGSGSSSQILPSIADLISLDNYSSALLLIKKHKISVSDVSSLDIHGIGLIDYVTQTMNNSSDRHSEQFNKLTLIKHFLSVHQQTKKPKI